MSSQRERAMKPTDLRGILRYVPMFRDHVFVIAVDGSIVSHENFANIVTDIAAGNDHVCVVLEPTDEEDLSRPIRCWGEGGVGQLGLENTSDIGDDEVVDSSAYDVDVVSTDPALIE